MFGNEHFMENYFTKCCREKYLAVEFESIIFVRCWYLIQHEIFSALISVEVSLWSCLLVYYMLPIFIFNLHMLSVDKRLSPTLFYLIRGQIHCMPMYY